MNLIFAWYTVTRLPCKERSDTTITIFHITFANKTPFLQEEFEGKLASLKEKIGTIVTDADVKKDAKRKEEDEKKGDEGEEEEEEEGEEEEGDEEDEDEE